jgi:hypothetical protein
MDGWVQNGLIGSGMGIRPNGAWTRPVVCERVDRDGIVRGAGLLTHVMGC